MIINGLTILFFFLKNLTFLIKIKFYKKYIIFNKVYRNKHLLYLNYISIILILKITFK